MTSIDDKTGYDHVFLSENSRTYFGIQCKGYYMYMITMYKTRPFGFISSVYIYHSLGKDNRIL